MNFFRSLVYAVGLGIAGLIGGFICGYFLHVIGLRMLGALVYLVAPVAGFVYGIVLAGKKETAISGQRASSVLAMVAAASEGNGVYLAHGPKWGIAVNGQTQQLALIADGKSKVYGFADVRGWETSLERAGFAINTFNMSGAMLADAANMRMRREARANSGVFIKVRDVDNPVWRIPILDKAQQQRWMEVLRQTINNA